MTENAELPPLYIAPYFVVGDLVTVRPEAVTNPAEGVFRITREPLRGKPPVYLAEPVEGDTAPISAKPYMLAAHPQD